VFLKISVPARNKKFRAGFRLALADIKSGFYLLQKTADGFNASRKKAPDLYRFTDINQENLRIKNRPLKFSISRNFSHIPQHGKRL
jgi:hypothetical protein